VTADFDSLFSVLHQLAQPNIAPLTDPIDSELLADFVALLEPVNALADTSPGFVWRLQTEDGDATAIRAFDDERIIVNMSVWASVDALAAFVYDSHHLDVMRRRRRWFERMDASFLVLWWVPEGHRPTPEEGRDRLEHLQHNGPTERAFTFKAPFPAPGSNESTPVDERWGCPAG
jgi:hypothetical protein